MADKIIRVLAKDAPVKASAITAKEMVERARQIHKTLPVATAALGRSLMAASMMGNQLKEKDGSVTLRIKGGGPLGGITVVSDSQGNARGYVVNPLVDLPLKGPAKLDVGSAVGRDGSLTVIKDLWMKEPYVGTVPLVSGEIAEDITSYFAESEQIPTACALGVLVDVDQSVQCAGGYLIQLLPGADDAAISAIEQGIARVGPVTEALRGGLSARELVEQVLAQADQIQQIARDFAGRDDVFFIGRNLDYALSMEGSLKLKEISYIHSEAYASGELKHGTISLIEEGTPVIALSTYGPLFDKAMSNVVEVQARGANVLALTTETHRDAMAARTPRVLTVPDVEPMLLPQLGVAPLQLLAYYIALERGCDIDKPRNLAKSVTVE